MARITPPEPYTTTAEHTLMDCPVCGGQIKAEIAVDATFGDAVYHGPDNIVLPVEHTLKSFSVMHACPGPPEPVEGGAA